MGRTYRVLETLGEGTFGAVHLAEVRDDEDFVQTLAVKWLHAQWSQDPEMVGRLRDEARLLAILDHEAIVRVNGITRIDGRLAVLMEPIAGVDLSRFDGPVPARVVAEVGAAVAGALDAAWGTVPRGREAPLHVVHRDIKPSNIMITPRGNVKVLDFGVARSTFDTREARTTSQQFGTARYMAPERWMEGRAEAPSDVWSLGVTLLELLTGAPFERPRLSTDGYEEDVGAALARVEDPELATWLTAMLGRDPSARPTAAAIAAAFPALAVTLPGPSLREFATKLPERRSSAAAVPTGTLLRDGSSGTYVFAPGAPTDRPAAEPTLALAPVGSTRPDGPTWDEFREQRAIRNVFGAALVALVLWFSIQPGGRQAPAVAPGPPEAPPPVALAAAPPAGAPIAPLEGGEVTAPSPAASAPPAGRPPATTTAGGSRPARPSPGPTSPGSTSPLPVGPPSPPATSPPATSPPTATPVRERSVIFDFDPPLSVMTPQGPARPHGALLVPEGLVHLRVEAPGGGWNCTVRVREGRSRIRFDAQHRKCE
jgi:serine/threonine protein kinase